MQLAFKIYLNKGICYQSRASKFVNGPNMKIGAGLVGTIIALVASAAVPEVAAGGYNDGPAYVVADWSGLYAGVNGGYAWDAVDRHGVEDNGGFGGGQIGYNWQGGYGLHPNLVVGVETDFEGVGISETRAGTLTWDSGGTDPDTHHRAINYVGTVRGRIGYAFGPVLPYFTGGFAYGNVTNEFNDTGSKHPGLFKDDGMKAGYVLGGGLEYKLSSAWSMMAEYQYIDLGHDDATGVGVAYVRTKDTELNTFRAGINYRLNSPLDSLK
jgi:outer membrane immunogenic protein